MTIQLNDKFKLTTEPLNFVLYQLKTIEPKDKTKPPYDEWVVEGYYADEQQAIRGCLKKGIMDEDLNGVREITEHIDLMAETICEKVRAILDK